MAEDWIAPVVHPDLYLSSPILVLTDYRILGNTLENIAGEAGSIKSGIPVIIGETTPETKPVFAKKAREVGAPILFAEEDEKDDYPGLECELKGLYQTKNTRTLLNYPR